MEISDIPNTISDIDLESTVISICGDSGVETDPKDIERCHRLPLSRNSRGQDKSDCQICQLEALGSPT